MTDLLAQYFPFVLMGISLIPFIVAQVVWKLLPQEKRDAILKADFEKKALPRIWKKTGISGSIWRPEYGNCPRDGSRLYVEGGRDNLLKPITNGTGFLFCPICSYCPGYWGTKSAAN